MWGQRHRKWDSIWFPKTSCTWSESMHHFQPYPRCQEAGWFFLVLFACIICIADFIYGCDEKMVLEIHESMRVSKLALDKSFMAHLGAKCKEKFPHCPCEDKRLENIELLVHEISSWFHASQQKVYAGDGLLANETEICSLWDSLDSLVASFDTSRTIKTVHSTVQKAATDMQYPAKSRFEASETIPKRGGTQIPPSEVTVFLCQLNR